MNATHAGPLSRNASAGSHPFALAYFLSYLFRVVNAVIAPNLQRIFTLAGRFRLLTSVYLSLSPHFNCPWGAAGPVRPRCIAAGLMVFAAAGRSLSRPPPVFGGCPSAAR